jgi:4-aminobutyrate aminotransferase-like enzyme
VERIAHADWAQFQKNGTDATTACVTIARAETGRRVILVAEGSYHGAAPWCTPVPAGTTAADRANQGRFAYNDVASLTAASDAAGQRPRLHHRDRLPATTTSVDQELGRSLPSRERRGAAHLRPARARC